MTTHAPEGWYPDPAGSYGERYWDGLAWTDDLRGVAVPEPAPEAPPAPAAPVEPARPVSLVAPGYYDDPASTGLFRYFDGVAWTDDYSETPFGPRSRPAERPESTCPVCGRTDEVVRVAEAVDAGVPPGLEQRFALAAQRGGNPLLLLVGAVVLAVAGLAAGGLVATAWATRGAAVVAVVIVVAATLVWLRKRAGQAESRAAQDAVARRVRDAYYCRRDDVAFDAGSSTPVSPEAFARGAAG